MADIEVVIKIPEGEYQHIKNVWRKRRGSVPWSYIAFGTPIPKGHGRLIDADLLLQNISCDEREVFTKHQVWLLASIYNREVPTIIPEDKDGANEVID